MSNQTDDTSRMQHLAWHTIVKHFPALEDLMRRYHNCPMDFADATLVYIAERESLSLILTIDHDDFETYRIGGRRRFRIVPPRDALSHPPRRRE